MVEDHFINNPAQFRALSLELGRVEKVRKSSQRVLRRTTYRQLFGLKVAPANCAVVADIPIAIDLGGQRADRAVKIGVIGTVHRQAANIP